MPKSSPSVGVRRAILACAALSGILFGPSARADTAGIVSGIGVFLDDSAVPGTPSTDKFGAVAPGDFFAVHIVTDVAAASSFHGASGARFRLKVDPRLQIMAKVDGADVSLSFETAPDEWDVAFTECSDGAVHLLTYYLQLPPGETDLDDIRVDVVDPADDLMSISTCTANSRLTPAFSAGGVVFNPSSPSIVHFSRSADVLVEGRELKLAWESAGAAQLVLNGNTVPSTGSLHEQPSDDASYLLEANDGGTTSRQIDVEVVRTPRVEMFTVESLTPGDAQVRLSWNVVGVDVIGIDGIGFDLGPFGTRVLPLLNPPDYRLTATNEWGTTQALATLDDEGQLPPSILSFAIQPAHAPYHTDVTLSWSVFNANQVDITPGIGLVDPMQGSLALSVESSQTYTLTATNEIGSVTDTVTLTMDLPLIHDFSASDPSPYPGEPTELQWEIVGAETVEIQPDVGFVDPSSGVLTVTPQSDITDYVLIATSPAGVAQRTVEVDWAAPSLDISSPINVVWGGTELDLEITIIRADAATLSPGPGSLIPPESQVVTVTVNEPTIFRLSATNAGGSSSRSLSVHARAPVARLEANETLVPAGTLVTLTADIQGAQTATLSPQPGDIDPAGGTFELLVDTSTRFQLDATNPTGTTTSSIDVLVEGETPIIHGFTADPTAILELQSSTLSWDVSDATEVRIVPGGYTTTELHGNLVVTLATDTAYRLIASSPFLSTEAMVTVEVEEHDLRIASFQPSLDSIAKGETVTLSWSAIDADHITIEPIGYRSSEASGALELIPAATTEYTLTAYHGPVSVESTAAVTVTPFRILGFEASSELFDAGEDVTLSWEVAGAADVSIDGFGTQPLVGSLVDTPTGISKTYTLRVRSGELEETREQTVLLVVPHDGLFAFSVDPEALQPEIAVPQDTPVTVYVLYLGSNWNGISGLSYKRRSHPNVVVLSDELLLPGTLNLGRIDLIGVELDECLSSRNPVTILSHEIVVRGPIALGETVLSFELVGHGSPPYAMTCANEEYDIYASFDLIWGSETVLPVLTLDLELDETPDGRLVRWDMNGEPDQLTVYRGESKVEMEPIHTMPGRAAGEWTDASAQLERPDYYRIEALVSGERISSEIVQARPSTPRAQGPTRLLANVPNPFNPSTEIRFVLEKPGSADVDIYDVSGRRVFHRPFHGLTAGEHFFVWGGLDRSGRSVSSGVYLVRLNADGKVDSRSITLVE